MKFLFIKKRRKKQTNNDFLLINQSILALIITYPQLFLSNTSDYTQFLMKLINKFYKKSQFSSLSPQFDRSQIKHCSKFPQARIKQSLLSIQLIKLIIKILLVFISASLYHYSFIYSSLPFLPQQSIVLCFPIRIEQSKEGMIPKPRRVSTLKYSILKPNSQVNFIKRNFTKPHPRCSYELAQNNHIALRRYKKTIESLDKTLQDYQWRLDSKFPIVRSLYVELLAQNFNSKSISLDIYVEDLQLTLSNMKRLLLQQAIYLIIKGVQGFYALWERFINVSVDEESIGLDCKGNCLVWLSNSLEKNSCDDCKFSTPCSITQEFISLVKSKSEPICYAFLGNLVDILSLADFHFEQIIRIVKNFAKTHKLIIPQNLKYLVYEDKKGDLINLKKNRSFHDNKQEEILKTPRFYPSRNSLQEDISQRSMIQNYKASRFQQMSPLRNTAGPAMYFLASFSRKSKNKSINSSIKHGKIAQTQTPKRLYTDKNHSLSSHHTRCKSQSYECLQTLTSLKPLQETVGTQSVKKSVKRYSGFSYNAKTGGSFIDKFKKSNHSLAEIQTVKKIIHRSSNQMDSKKYFQTSIPQFKQKQSSFIERQEQQIQIPINIISPLQSLNPTFHIIPDEIIKANQWTTTLTNLLQTSQRLNTSITEGQDTNTYLSDVRLQKLDTLSNKRMAASIIPESDQ